MTKGLFAISVLVVILAGCENPASGGVPDLPEITYPGYIKDGSVSVQVRYMTQSFDNINRIFFCNYDEAFSVVPIMSSVIADGANTMVDLSPLRSSGETKELFPANVLSRLGIATLPTRTYAWSGGFYDNLSASSGRVAVELVDPSAPNRSAKFVYFTTRVDVSGKFSATMGNGVVVDYDIDLQSPVGVSTVVTETSSGADGTMRTKIYTAPISGYIFQIP